MTTDARDESQEQRDDRNLAELLQELRVAGLGVQVLFGFLLSLPFQARFTRLSHAQRDLYLASLVLAALATALLLGPVAYHRLVFRRGQKERLVRAANVMALLGLGVVGLAVSTAVLLVTGFVVSALPAALIGAFVFCLFGGTWLLFPLARRNDREKPLAGESTASTPGRALRAADGAGRGSCGQGRDNSAMTKKEAAAQVREAKARLGLTWAQLAAAVGRPIAWTTAALLGQHPMTKEQASAAASLLDLDDDARRALLLQPSRGDLDAAVPTDPTMYRFYEVLQVYGTTIKELIHEEFGDGIMSAINFRLDISREPDPAGDRVVVTLNGKFLPYQW